MLVDRDEAIKLLRGKCVGKYPTTFLPGLFAAANEIHLMNPADAVQVVRCKNCVDYDQGRCLGNHDICSEEEYWFYVEPEDYCSRGRLKTDGK